MDHKTILAGLGLSQEQLAQRRNGLGGSDANTIMSGDAERIERLWLEKRGEAQPEDLSGVLPVQLGSFTEAFNAAWYEHTEKREIADRNTRVESPAFDHMFVNLDGRTTTAAGAAAVWEAKHVGAFVKIEDVVQRYVPQLHHGMHCAQVDKAILSVIQGNHAYHVIEIDRDDWYLARLIEAEREFWDCVKTGRRPVPAAAVEAKDVVAAHRTVDMTGNNGWAVAANDWLEARPMATLFESAVKRIKELTPEDAKTAFGHGIRVSRAKNGALKIGPEAA